MEKKIKVTDALTQVYTALCMLTVQGPDNARILATVCNDLKVIIKAIEKDGGEKQGEDTSESSVRKLPDDAP